MNSITYILIGVIAFIICIMGINKYLIKDDQDIRSQFFFRTRPNWFSVLFVIYLGYKVIEEDSLPINIILFAPLFVYWLYYMVKPPLGKVSLSDKGYWSFNAGRIKLDKLKGFEINEYELLVHSLKYHNHDKLSLKDLKNADLEELAAAFEAYAEQFDHINFSKSASSPQVPA